MVQAKGIRPLDSRLSAEREASSKYSTPARSRAFGLSAARRAIPTRGVGAGLSAQMVGMGHLDWSTHIVSLFIRLLSKPKFQGRWAARGNPAGGRGLSPIRGSRRCPDFRRKLLVRGAGGQFGGGCGG